MDGGGIYSESPAHSAGELGYVHRAHLSVRSDRQTRLGQPMSFHYAIRAVERTPTKARAMLEPLPGSTPSWRMAASPRASSFSPRRDAARPWKFRSRGAA